MSDRCCLACGQPLPTAPDRAAEALTLMRAGCAVMGIVPTWDDHVSERDAARLLNRSPSTLKNRRGLDAPLPYRRSGNRIEYALADLCLWGGKIDSDEPETARNRPNLTGVASTPRRKAWE